MPRTVVSLPGHKDEASPPDPPHGEPLPYTVTTGKGAHRPFRPRRRSRRPRWDQQLPSVNAEQARRRPLPSEHTEPPIDEFRSQRIHVELCSETHILREPRSTSSLPEEHDTNTFHRRRAADSKTAIAAAASGDRFPGNVAAMAPAPSMSSSADRRDRLSIARRRNDAERSSQDRGRGQFGRPDRGRLNVPPELGSPPRAAYALRPRRGGPWRGWTCTDCKTWLAYTAWTPPAPAAHSRVLLWCTTNCLDLEPFAVEDKGPVERRRVLRSQTGFARIAPTPAQRRIVEGLHARSVWSLKAHVKSDSWGRASVALPTQNPEHGGCPRRGSVSDGARTLLAAA